MYTDGKKFRNLRKIVSKKKDRFKLLKVVFAEERKYRAN